MMLYPLHLRKLRLGAAPSIDEPAQMQRNEPSVDIYQMQLPPCGCRHPALSFDSTSGWQDKNICKVLYIFELIF
jgi:hypothetical protein